jgi:hypothetical protein
MKEITYYKRDLTNGGWVPISEQERVAKHQDKGRVLRAQGKPSPFVLDYIGQMEDEKLKISMHKHNGLPMLHSDEPTGFTVIKSRGKPSGDYKIEPDPSKWKLTGCSAYTDERGDAVEAKTYILDPAWRDDEAKKWVKPEVIHAEPAEDVKESVPGLMMDSFNWELFMRSLR